MQKSPNISIVFFMKRVGGIVPSPIQAAIIVPNWEHILCPCSHIYCLGKDLTHQSHKILSGISVLSGHSITLLPRKLFHHAFNYVVGSAVEFLKIVAEISHDMVALKDSFQKLVFPIEIVNIVGFS